MTGGQPPPEEEGMPDTYSPPAPDEAVCPHCQATIAGVASPNAALWMVTLCCRCPACGQRWNEIREGDETLRFFTPVEAPRGKRPARRSV